MRVGNRAIRSRVYELVTEFIGQVNPFQRYSDFIRQRIAESRVDIERAIGALNIIFEWRCRRPVLARHAGQELAPVSAGNAGTKFLIFII